MRWRLSGSLTLLLALLVLAAAPPMAQGHGPGKNGWNHGRKAGWGNCDLPPGIAKKRGCYPTRYRLVRYPVERGGIVVVRVPIDHRGWYWVDDDHRLWVDEGGFWRDDHTRVRLDPGRTWPFAIRCVRRRALNRPQRIPAASCQFTGAFHAESRNRRCYEFDPPP